MWTGEQQDHMQNQGEDVALHDNVERFQRVLKLEGKSLIFSSVMASCRAGTANKSGDRHADVLMQERVCGAQKNIMEEKNIVIRTERYDNIFISSFFLLFKLNRFHSI